MHFNAFPKSFAPSSLIQLQSRFRLITVYIRIWILTRSNNTSRFRKESIEAVFRTKIFGFFSREFRWKLVGKKYENFRSEYCFHVPAFSGAFLQDPMTFSLLFWRFSQDPDTGTFATWVCFIEKKTNFYYRIVLYCISYELRLCIIDSTAA